MQGLDYYMDGLLHEYLNQPDEDEEAQAEGVLDLLNDYYEDEE